MKRALLLALALLVASAVAAGPAAAAKPSAARSTGTVAVSAGPHYWGDVVTVSATWSGVKAPQYGWSCRDSSGQIEAEASSVPDWHAGAASFQSYLWGIGWSGPRGHADCTAWLTNGTTLLASVPFAVDNAPPAEPSVTVTIEGSSALYWGDVLVITARWSTGVTDPVLGFTCPGYGWEFSPQDPSTGISTVGWVLSGTGHADCTAWAEYRGSDPLIRDEVPFTVDDPPIT